MEEQKKEPKSLRRSKAEIAKDFECPPYEEIMNATTREKVLAFCTVMCMSAWEIQEIAMLVAEKEGGLERMWCYQDKEEKGVLPMSVMMNFDILTENEHPRTHIYDKLYSGNFAHLDRVEDALGKEMLAAVPPALLDKVKKMKKPFHQGHFVGYMREVSGELLKTKLRKHPDDETESEAKRRKDLEDDMRSDVDRITREACE